MPVVRVFKWCNGPGVESGVGLVILMSSFQLRIFYERAQPSAPVGLLLVWGRHCPTITPGCLLPFPCTAAPIFLTPLSKENHWEMVSMRWREVCEKSVISPIVVLPWDLPTLMALIWGYYRNWDWCNSPDTLKWYPWTCYPRKTWTRPFHLCWAKATPNRVPGRYHS